SCLQGSRVSSGGRALPPGSPIPAFLGDFVYGSSILRLVVGNTGSAFDSILAARSIRVLWMGLVRDLPPGGSTPNTVVVADRIRNFKGTLYNLRSQRPFRFKALDAEVHRFGGVEVRAI